MTLKLPVYLDYNSTTPVDPAVVEEMLPYFTDKFGNAASRTHTFGWVADEAVEFARRQVARLINAEPTEIIFTSGSTEGVNLAIKGVFEMYASKGNHIITVSTEHKSALDACNRIEQKGAEVTYLPVNSQGLINLTELENAITEKTLLISVMYANNEIGLIQPINEIAEIAHRHKVIFMSDATQAIGKIKVDVQEDRIDLMPLSAHKFYGPKGAGALYVRRRDPRVRLTSQIDGGGHEKGLRSGTLNVPGIVGLGKACELANNDLEENGRNVMALRDRLQTELMELGDVTINGREEKRLPNTLNISFKHIESQLLIKALSDKVAVATGSACTSAVPEPSYVLKALGLTDEDAYSSVRFSLGKFTTEEEIDYVIKQVKKEVGKLRGIIRV